MIKICEGDLFSSSAPIIAHQVNCQGVMGSGVARQVKERYPAVFEQYKKYAKADSLGDCLLINSDGEVIGEQGVKTLCYDDTVIANLFAQSTYGYDGKQYTDLSAFNSACIHLLISAKSLGVNSIAMPYKIGCARGGAPWSSVYMILEGVFGKEVDIELWKLPENIKEEDLYVQCKRSKETVSAVDEAMVQ